MGERREILLRDNQIYIHVRLQFVHKRTAHYNLSLPAIFQYVPCQRSLNLSFFTLVFRETTVQLG